jgi:hypothetical protein
MPESLPFPSEAYFEMLAVLLAARGLDFLSTWLATPTLALEGNPIAKKLGWGPGAVVNVIICFVFASWPVPAVIIATTGVLVAAHNFHGAWLMRSMGEREYRLWFTDQLYRSRLALYFGCLFCETLLTTIVGAAIVWFSPSDSAPFAIGVGFMAYAILVLFYSVLGALRIRRNGG